MNTIADIASLVVAIAALLIAYRAERRNQTRFEEQLRHSQALVQAQIRPLLTISSQVYVSEKSIRLINRGLGAAIILKIEFGRGEHTTSNLVELFQIKSKQEFRWEAFRRFSSSKIFLGPGETIDLVRISEEQLLAQKIPQEEVRSILDQWQDQKSGISVIIEYEDALGNRQPSCTDILS